MLSRDDQLRIELNRCSSIELESWLWSAVSMQEWMNDDTATAFYGYLVPAIQAEVTRRESIADPLTPLRVATAKLDLERIKADIPLTDALLTIASVELRKRGNNWIGRCPFPDHRDSMPSLSVRADGMLWRCWGCGKGGDLFTFGQNWYDTRSFIAAVEMVVVGMGRRIEHYRIDQPLRRGITRVA